MQPEIHLGPLTLQTFGIMFALAFLAAGALLARRLREWGKPTDWAYEQVFKIIDRRYREMLPLVVTTNLASSALDARLLSRLQDRKYSVVIDIDGQRYGDHRRAG